MRAAQLQLGAIYHPHLAPAILNLAGRLGYLALSGPPDEEDPYFQEIRAKFHLTLQDVMSDVCEDPKPEDLVCARELAALCRADWIEMRLERSQTTDGQVRLETPIPPLYTEEFLRRCSQSLQARVREISVPLLIENTPAFLELNHPRMSEPEFLRRLVGETGCGLALDVTGAYLSAYHSGRDPEPFLREFPLDRVVELQVGGLADNPELGGPWISAALPNQQILDLAGMLIDHAPELRGILFDAQSPTLGAETLTEAAERLASFFQLVPK